MITGRCECSRIEFEIDGPIEDFCHCHCSQCRRLHGAAYATFAGVAGKDFRYRSGEDQLRVYASSQKNDRYFCGHCGSTIMVISRYEPDVYYLSMSTIDGDPDLPAAYHQFTGSKAPWHEINDDLPRYEGPLPGEPGPQSGE